MDNITKKDLSLIMLESIKNSTYSEGRYDFLDNGLDYIEYEFKLTTNGEELRHRYRKTGVKTKEGFAPEEITEARDS